MLILSHLSFWGIYDTAKGVFPLAVIGENCPDRFVAEDKDQIKYKVVINDADAGQHHTILLTDTMIEVQEL